MDKDTESKWQDPVTLKDDAFKSANYGGSRAIFARGKECEGCRTRPPFDLAVNITKTLTKLKLHRFDAKLKIYGIDPTEPPSKAKLVSFDKTGLPNPVIKGPMFDNDNIKTDFDGNKSSNVSEIESLQEFLQLFGYYKDKKDGMFGKNSDNAMKLFLKAANVINTSDIKLAIRHLHFFVPKLDSIVKNINGSNVSIIGEKDSDSKTNIYEGYDEIPYFIGVSPADLSRNAVIDCISQAFNLWSVALNKKIKFKLVIDSDDALIKLKWKRVKSSNNLLQFDRPGGVLAGGGIIEYKNKFECGLVLFDWNEQWVIGTPTRFHNESLQGIGLFKGKQMTFSLFNASVHCIGRALGLKPSNDPNDFMSPFYNANKTQLSKNDVSNIKKQFSIE